MDKIDFPYRSSSHLPFLHVVAESESWAKYDPDGIITTCEKSTTAAL